MVLGVRGALLGRVVQVESSSELPKDLQARPHVASLSKPTKYKEGCPDMYAVFFADCVLAKPIGSKSTTRHQMAWYWSIQEVCMAGFRCWRDYNRPLLQLETYPDLEGSIIRTTKIHIH